MKTALVTGGAGFVGSHLCERLAEDENNDVYSDLNSIIYFSASNIPSRSSSGEFFGGDGFVSRFYDRSTFVGARCGIATDTLEGRTLFSFVVDSTVNVDLRHSGLSGCDTYYPKPIPPSIYKKIYDQGNTSGSARDLFSEEDVNSFISHSFPEYYELLDEDDKPTGELCENAYNYNLDFSVQNGIKPYFSPISALPISVKAAPSANPATFPPVCK